MKGCPEVALLEPPPARLELITLLQSIEPKAWNPYPPKDIVPSTGYGNGRVDFLINPYATYDA